MIARTDSRKREVLYVTWDERIWQPLIQRQVIELLVEVGSRVPAARITLASFVPLHAILRNRPELERIRGVLAAQGVRTWIVPTVVPWPIPLPRFHWQRGQAPRPMPVRHPVALLPCLLATVLPVLLFGFARGVRLFHCRSYPASVAAMILRCSLRQCRLIFDPRSDFPEENVTAGAWRRDSTAFAIWKWLESKLLKVADVTVCPAETYVQAFRARCPSLRSELIPNNVDARVFVFDESQRSRVRSALGIGPATLVFCYLGEIAEGAWHRPSSYARLARQLRSQQTPHVVLFLVPAGARAELVREMEKAGVGEDEYLIEHPGYAEVPRMLSAADYGLMLLVERKTAVGTKIVEYLGCGLPIVVNANCLGAIGLIERFGIGQIFNVGLGDLDHGPTPPGDLPAPAAPPRRREISEIARQNFGNTVVAERYAVIYRRCLDARE